MEKEFVPYELALKLKELGFDEPCLGFYDGKGGTKIYFNTLRNGSGDYKPFSINERFSWFGAPTFSQAFRWFREKHELFCWIEKFHVDETYIFQIPPANFTKIQGHYITYEEAELACLTKLIEIVEIRTK